MPITKGYPEEPHKLATVFAELIEAAKHVERETPLPPTNPHDVVFRDALQVKYCKMGLRR